MSRRIEELILCKIPGYTLLEELPDGMLAVFVLGDPEHISGNPASKVTLDRAAGKAARRTRGSSHEMHHAAWRRCWPAAESNAHEARDSPGELLEVSRYGTLSSCSFRRCLRPSFVFGHLCNPSPNEKAQHPGDHG